MLVLLRGGGDLASGVALRLQRAGLRVLVSELAQPQAVRRLASFASAIYDGQITIEGVTARRVEDLEQAMLVLARGEIPVLVDPSAGIRRQLRPEVIVDGRMVKKSPDLSVQDARLVIGLGPGFTAGKNCHAVIETQRGHFLGRVIWHGGAAADTGIPESVGEQSAARVIRAPADGHVAPAAQIGDRLAAGQRVGEVAGVPFTAPFQSVLRGLVHPAVYVHQGMKIGDLDPRNDPRYCNMVSDKALAIGGGVLEAILSQQDLRDRLWD